ncbi:zinc transporter ZupT [Luteococcus sp. Sow4_B9]|uniref:zinc transporter ZupT n=1 Tax=Luteococcus sp. Sow4_B9 TaxID=3438792 RepID=UPI003F9D0285
MQSGIIGAVALTVLAGLATALGGLVVIGRREVSTRLLASGLGLSAGVMIYISFMELLPTGIEHLGGGAWGVLWFFAGIGLILLIDRFVPESVNPHEPSGLPGSNDPELARRGALMRTGLVTAVVITLHNLPEGFATLVTSLEDFRAGAMIAVAIAIHNIPEGIAVSVPIYAATGSRAKAFWYAAGSGLSEPLGAIVLYLLLAPFITPALLGACLCAVAGVMVFVSLDELLPSAQKFGEHHAAIYGLVAGMAVMAVSLELLS